MCNRNSLHYLIIIKKNMSFVVNPIGNLIMSLCVFYGTFDAAYAIIRLKYTKRMIVLHV